MAIDFSDFVPLLAAVVGVFLATRVSVREINRLLAEIRRLNRESRSSSEIVITVTLDTDEFEKSIQWVRGELGNVVGAIDAVVDASKGDDGEG